jgi:CSLREA domain-containing protein
MRHIGWTLAVLLSLATGCDEGGAGNSTGPGDDTASEDRSAPPADAWVPGCTGEILLTSWRDHDDADPDDGVCETGKGDDGQPECTLRAAITQANVCPGPDEILQSGEGYATAIEPASPLPVVTEALTIDGTAQPILVLGMGAGAGTHGLHVAAGDTILRGIRFERFGGDGVHAEIGEGDLIHLVNVGLTDNCGWGLWSNVGPQ